MNKKALFTAMIIALAVFVVASTTSAGEIVQSKFYSNALKRDYRFVVYLPSGYEGSAEKYPVMYHHHTRRLTFRHNATHMIFPIL